jgi:thymidylate synthase (FAD)
MSNQPEQPEENDENTVLNWELRLWSPAAMTTEDGKLTLDDLGYTGEPPEEFMVSDVTVELVQHAGDDTSAVHAARVSTQGDRVQAGFERWGRVTEDNERNEGLINFLMRERHGSPFEHNSMTFFIQAPIFVFREFHRHRAGWSYNEESGRYKILDKKFYAPDGGRPLVQVGKPGAYEYVAGTEHQHRVVWHELNVAYAQAWESYQAMLAAGIAREVARLSLPVGVLSSMYATCNARSLMHFLSLRTKDERAKVKSGPQWEIELVARKMEAEWAGLMPYTHKAFNDNGRVAP